MSRIPIPYPYGSLDCTYYKHVGIIGYRPGRFCSRCGALLEDPEDDERP